MREITLEELLEAGCHFGHQVNRQNPKAREFIFEVRSNVHIIDLAKTKEGLEAAAEFVRNLASQGATIIFVGTKRQAKTIIREEALRLRSLQQGSGQAGQANSGVFYVDERWIGGTLTNFEEIVKNFKKLKDIRKKLEDREILAKYTKREIGLWRKEMLSLEKLYGGIEDLEKIPDCLYVVDTHLEEGAVKEAIRMGVTIVGIVDTNSDPTIIDYPIPANDDAVGSVKLITTHIADAWMEGARARKKEAEKRTKEEEKAKGREDKKEEMRVKKAAKKERSNGKSKS